MRRFLMVLEAAPWRPLAVVALALSGLALWARAQGPAGSLPTLPPEAPPASRHDGPSPPKAVAVVDGEAAPGLRLTLDAGRSTGRDLHYRWVQTQGPPVALDDATAPAARFVVPDAAATLGFVLVAANAEGADSATVTIPVAPRGRAPTALRADAGDDQVGLIGRQVTLNGQRSEPRGQVGFRWVQTGGPRVRLKIEDGYIFSFVPPAPGVYRFALLVASGSEISEPDTVQVSVGSATAPGLEAPAEPAASPADVARAALLSIRGGPELGGELGEVFEAVADKMELYASYGVVLREVALRLEPFVPPHPARRAAWDERLFAPLSALLIDRMRAEGLDLARPEAQAAALSPAQKARLAELFRAMAEGFQTARPAS